MVLKFVENEGGVAVRQRCMAALARGSAEELAGLWDRIGSDEKPAVTELRPPEFGLAMVRGRAGGRGAPFNVGEVTVTRCTVRTREGVLGTSYLMGRDVERARIAATLDAMVQSEPSCELVLRQVIEPLEASVQKAEDQASRKTAATKVDFFTMVRSREKKT